MTMHTQPEVVALYEAMSLLTATWRFAGVSVKAQARSQAPVWGGTIALAQTFCLASQNAAGHGNTVMCFGTSELRLRVASSSPSNACNAHITTAGGKAALSPADHTQPYQGTHDLQASRTARLLGP